MKFQLIALYLSATLLLTMCGGGTTEKKDTSEGEKTNNTEQTAEKSETIDDNKPAEKPAIKDPFGDGAPTPTPVPKVEAVTLKPLIQSYCKALNSKNESDLQKLYSAASWKRLKADASEEGEAKVVDYLNNSEPVGDKCEVINEQIDGNVAEANVITKSYAGPNGVRWTFVKEGGSWKLTTESSDFDAVKNAG